MKLTEHPDPPTTRLLIVAENDREEEILQAFARLKEPLTATIEHDPAFTNLHLIIRKEKS